MNAYSFVHLESHWLYEGYSSRALQNAQKNVSFKNYLREKKQYTQDIHKDTTVFAPCMDRRKQIMIEQC